MLKDCEKAHSGGGIAESAVPCRRGSAANDAVRLAFADDITPAMIERADLFAVAEIKRDRGGKVEMKFFDRQKALEKLIDCEREESGAAGAENLISAIYGNVSGKGKGEEP